MIRPDTPWERVLFEPGGQGDSKAATVKARVGVGVVHVGVHARVNVGMRRRMERRGRGKCIFAMMMSERWLFVCGERELGDGDVRGLKVREEKIYRARMYTYHSSLISLPLIQLCDASCHPTCAAVSFHQIS